MGFGYLYGRFRLIWSHLNPVVWVLTVLVFGSLAARTPDVKTAGILVADNGRVKHYICDGSDKEYENMLQVNTVDLAQVLFAWPKDPKIAGLRLAQFWKLGGAKGSEAERAFIQAGRELRARAKESVADFTVEKVDVRMNIDQSAFIGHLTGWQRIDSGIQVARKVELSTEYAIAKAEDRDDGKVFLLTKFEVRDVADGSAPRK